MGDAIFYEKTVLWKDAFHTLIWQYPQSQKARMDAPVTRTVAAFSGQELSGARHCARAKRAAAKRTASDSLQNAAAQNRAAQKAAIQNCATVQGLLRTARVVKFPRRPGRPNSP